MNIPVCVRDGCEIGNITIGELKFEMDLSELNNIIVSARLGLRESLLTNAAMLRTALECMEEAISVTMQNSVRPATKEEMENWWRWHETGCGGYQNLEKAREAIKEMKCERESWRKRRTE